MAATIETNDEGLNERAQQLLKLLVEHYIRDGQPVGSRTLSRDLGLRLSAATIRNVMADLEDLGFVATPHTSAGRIPTDKGYRFFVDTLLKYQPVEHDKIAAIRERLGAHADDPKAIVAAASQLLSNVTRLAGVVTLPPGDPRPGCARARETPSGGKVPLHPIFGSILFRPTR